MVAFKPTNDTKLSKLRLVSVAYETLLLHKITVNVRKHQVCCESKLLSADSAEATRAARLRGVMRKCGDSLRSVNSDVYTFFSPCGAVSGARVSATLLSQAFVFLKSGMVVLPFDAEAQ